MPNPAWVCHGPRWALFSCGRANLAARIRFFLLGLLLFTWLAMPQWAHGQDAAGQRRAFVVLYSQHMGFPVADGIGAGLFAAAREAGYSVAEMHVEYLDLVRHPDPAHRKVLAKLLRKRLKDKRIEAVFTEGGPAYDFALREGAALFPDALLITNVPVLSGLGLLGERKLVHYPWRPDFIGTVEHALASFPDTRRVLVVLGASASDRPHAESARAQLARFDGRVEFEYTDALGYDEMIARVEAAGPGTLILYQVFFGDANGRSSVPIEVARAVSQRAKVPVFVTSEVFVGLRMVGGSILRTEAFGHGAGQIALNRLNHTLDLSQQVTTLLPRYVPIFDWQELARWGVPPSRLPADALFVNRPPTLWGQYRAQVIVVAVAFAAMAALAAALFVQSRRRRQAELAANESEARFRLLTEAAPEAIFVCDIDEWRIVSANANAVELLGCDRETLLGGPPERFYSANQPDGLPIEVSLLETRRRALAGEVVSLERTVVRQRDGEEIHCDVRLVMLPHPKQRLLRATLTDISSRKAIESALHFVAQRAVLKGPVRDSFQELLRFLCAALRLDHALLMRREHGGAFEPVATIADGAALDPACAEAAARVIDAPEHWRDVHVIAASARSRLPADAPAHALLDAWAAEGYAMAPLWDAQGAAIGAIVLTSRDALRHPDRVVSVLQIVAARAAQELEGLRTEEAQQRQQIHLEEQVALRTAELAQANESLASARDAAESATRAKSEFLANMSHELRTPMNAIIGLSQLALQTELGDKARNYIAKLNGAGKNLLGIINDILDFSKVEAGKMHVEHIDVDLEQVLDHVALLVAEKAQSKGLELIFDVAPDVPRALVGDPLRLGQILTNYANNAVKFTERGEITLSVQVQERAGDEVLLRFDVRDTGIGLSEAQMARLFQSFEQADGSITRRYGGTGLGLVISKHLAELMGGSVGADSRLGEGSTFWFTARLHRREDAAPLPPRMDARGRRLLVVDDNDPARRVMRTLLQTLGFAVETAASGNAALMAIWTADRRGQPFDAVLLDWRMPGMDGVQTAEALRALPLQRPPHLMMVTGHGREDVAAPARDAGIEIVLPKPVSPSVLFDHVIRLLGTEAGGATPAPPAPTGRPDDPHGLHGLRVLLVEDNEINQEVAAGLMNAVGIRVDIAGNGEAALRQVQAGPYDVVLMDMQMPVMDGVSATAAIRQLRHLDPMPIIAMTANAMPADRDRCLQAGMVDFISKPIDPDELWRTLLRWTRPARPTGQATRDAGDPLAAPAPALPAIPGLDTQTGLHRVMGRQALYLSLLHKFADGQRDVAADIRAALQDRDREAAQRLAHTLKGVAGNIGAEELAASAAALEAALAPAAGTEGPAQAPPLASSLEHLLEHLQARLRPLLAGLDAHFAAAGEPDGPAASPPPAAALERLRALVNDDDPAAATWLQAHAGALRQALGARYGQLARDIGRYDFEAAQATLAEALGPTAPRQ